MIHLMRMEKETNNNLLLKLNSMNSTVRGESQACKKDNALLREELEAKVGTLRSI